MDGWVRDEKVSNSSAWGMKKMDRPAFVLLRGDSLHSFDIIINGGVHDDGDRCLLFSEKHDQPRERENMGGLFISKKVYIKN